MAEAIATLKRTARHRNFLYDLPWYLIISPPGAGKTTALVKSGLRFPLAGSGEAQPVSGVGGTRYCDWWFTDDAVIIDTAGRYTTQDSDADADGKAGSLSSLS
jgi:type VI secretion system protein ImpL